MQSNFTQWIFHMNICSYVQTSVIWICAHMFMRSDKTYEYMFMYSYVYLWLKRMLKHMLIWTFVHMLHTQNDCIQFNCGILQDLSYWEYFSILLRSMVMSFTNRQNKRICLWIHATVKKRQNTYVIKSCIFACMLV